MNCGTVGRFFHVIRALHRVGPKTSVTQFQAVGNKANQFRFERALTRRTRLDSIGHTIVELHTSLLDLY